MLSKADIDINSERELLVQKEAIKEVWHGFALPFHFLWQVLTQNLFAKGLDFYGLEILILDMMIQAKIMQSKH